MPRAAPSSATGARRGCAWPTSASGRRRGPHAPRAIRSPAVCRRRSTSTPSASTVRIDRLSDSRRSLAGGDRERLGATLDEAGPLLGGLNLAPPPVGAGDRSENLHARRQPPFDERVGESRGIFRALDGGIDLD